MEAAAMVTSADPRCVVCKGLVGDGPDLMPSVLVSFEGRLEEVCTLCVEKADPEIHPDYTEDED